MKKTGYFVFCLLICTVFTLPASAQFPIKLPKIGQPKPTPAPTAPTNASNPAGSVDQRVTAPGTTGTLPSPGATDSPVMLKTTLDIRADTEARYWKMPGESNYTSWVPQVRFNVLYNGAAKLRLMAEYFTPDGKAWTSETLKQNTASAQEQTVELITDRVGDRFTNRSTNAVGTFGIKITDTRDGKVLFQGKFKVGKFKYGPDIPMFKNQYDFFVEQDWNMPIGYVWLDSSTDKHGLLPTFSVWIKGENRLDDLEARLFYNGQQIATTDDMGAAGSKQRRYPNSLQNKETHRWELLDFAWYKFRYAATPQGRKMFANAKFMNDMAGDYSVKVFHKGVQIREAAFSVVNGEFVDNGIAKNNSFAEHKVIVPVKIMGDKDKWNTTQWKTDAFYGNPLAGFSWQ